jgi:hypothetical protein
VLVLEALQALCGPKNNRRREQVCRHRPTTLGALELHSKRAEDRFVFNAYADNEAGVSP